MSPHAKPIATTPISPTPTLTTSTPHIPSHDNAYHAHELRQDSSRINLGPLTTTTWTPPPACASIFPNCETCTVAHAAQTCMGQGPASMSEMKLCFPPRSNGATTTTGSLKGWGIYSPGIVCPAGYTSVAESTYGSNNFGFQFPLQTGETAVGCCPTPGPAINVNGASYTATVQNGFQSCKLVVTPGGGVDVGSCAASGQPSFTSKVFPFTGTGQQQIVVPSLEVLAPLVQVVWQSSDLAAGVKGPNGVAAGGGGENGRSGLSTGAQAGIGIAVALLVIILVVLAFWWKRRAQRREQEMSGGGSGAGEPLAVNKNSIFNRFSRRPSPGKHQRKYSTITHPKGVAEAGNTQIAQLDDDAGRGVAANIGTMGSTAATRQSGTQRVNADPVELAA